MQHVGASRGVQGKRHDTGEGVLVVIRQNRGVVLMHPPHEPRNCIFLARQQRLQQLVRIANR